MSINKRKSQSNFNRSSQTAINSDRKSLYETKMQSRRSSTQLEAILEKKSADCCTRGRAPKKATTM